MKLGQNVNTTREERVEIMFRVICEKGIRAADARDARGETKQEIEIYWAAKVEHSEKMNWQPRQAGKEERQTSLPGTREGSDG